MQKYSKIIFTHALKWGDSKYKVKWSSDKSHYSANTNSNSPIAQRERYQCLRAVSQVRDGSESEMNWAQREWKKKGKQKKLCISHMCKMAHSNRFSFREITITSDCSLIMKLQSELSYQIKQNKIVLFVSLLVSRYVNYSDGMRLTYIIHDTHILL